eukprot:gene8061-10921_t
MKRWFVTKKIFSTLNGKYPTTTTKLEKNVIPPAERVYLAVPYDEKDRVKELGARFDGDNRSWYVDKFESLNPIFDEFQRVYLEVSYEQSSELKKEGGLWDPQMKRWFVTKKIFSTLNGKYPTTITKLEKNVIPPAERVYLAVPYEKLNL